VSLANFQKTDGSTLQVAVKALHQHGVPESESKQFEYEARLLVALEHPHIIHAIGVCFRSSPQLLVLELMSGGDLKKYLRDNRASLFSLPSSLGRACVQIADAMEYLERKRVVHRDLAARFDFPISFIALPSCHRNILVGANGLETVKLSDVGLSRTLASSDYYRKTSNNKVPVKWMAPESILERVYTSASDVWSFGVLCWEVYSFGETPYPRKAAEEVLIAIAKGYRMERPALCPENMYESHVDPF
jgi:serine/threonine protein kinase